MDKKRLMQHVAPVVTTFPLETGTVLMALNMGHCLSNAPTKPPTKPGSVEAQPQKAHPDKSQLARLVPTRRNVRGFRFDPSAALSISFLTHFCLHATKNSPGRVQWASFILPLR